MDKTEGLAVFESLDDSYFDEKHTRERVKPSFLASHASKPEKPRSRYVSRRFLNDSGLSEIVTTYTEYGEPEFVIPATHAMDSAWSIPERVTVVAGSEDTYNLRLGLS